MLTNSQTSQSKMMTRKSRSRAKGVGTANSGGKTSSSEDRSKKPLVYIVQDMANLCDILQNDATGNVTFAKKAISLLQVSTV